MREKATNNANKDKEGKKSTTNKEEQYKSRVKVKCYSCGELNHKSRVKTRPKMGSASNVINSTNCFRMRKD